MKKSISLGVMVASLSFWAGASCVDLSGIYEFGGFDGKDCKINNESVMHISPLPLGSVIRANTEIEIKQKSCSDIKLIYRDGRYSNTQDVDATHSLEMNNTVVGANEISSKEVDAGTVCAMGCLTSRDSTKWSLSLTAQKDLKMTFKHTSVGVYNFIIPTVDYVRAKCTLRRVN